MPTLTIDTYQAWYQERADLAYSWDEEGVNRYGSISHSTRPGDGAQYDPTRATQFTVFGFRATCGGNQPRYGGYRRIGCQPAEGPHETCATLCFKPSVGAITCTDARLTLTVTDVGGGSSFPASDARVYGVKVPQFCTRQLDASCGYPLTYRGEFHQTTWGAPRRYVSDSLEYEMPHTIAEVGWYESAHSVNIPFQTPNLAAVVNEIFAQPGWVSGNRMCLIFAPNLTIDVQAITGTAPDLGAGSFSTPCLLAPTTLTLTY